MGDHIEYNGVDISGQLTISKGWAPMDVTGTAFCLITVFMKELRICP